VPLLVPVPVPVPLPVPVVWDGELVPLGADGDEWPLAGAMPHALQ
jgi:hypothetical protein